MLDALTQFEKQDMVAMRLTSPLGAILLVAGNSSAIVLPVRLRGRTESSVKEKGFLSMKTVYIPAGATYNYETLVTDNAIVHGHLHVTNGSESETYFRQRISYRR